MDQDPHPIPGTDEYYRQMWDEDVFGDRRLFHRPYPAIDLPQDRPKSAEAEEFIESLKNGSTDE